MFSRVIYTLAVIDITLVSTFFYDLSKLSDEALRASPHIDFSFWVDYPGWIIITILLPVYLHYYRYDFENKFAKAFNLHKQLHSKFAMYFFCYFCPVAMLIVMLIRSSNWVFLNSGPSV